MVTEEGGLIRLDNPPHFDGRGHGAEGFLLGWTRGSVSASLLVCQCVKVSCPSLFTPFPFYPTVSTADRLLFFFLIFFCIPSLTHLLPLSSSSSCYTLRLLFVTAPGTTDSQAAVTSTWIRSEREGDRERVWGSVCECVCACAHSAANGPFVLRSWRWKRSATGPGLCRSSTSCCCLTRPLTMRSARCRTRTRPSSPWRYGAPFSFSTPPPPPSLLLRAITYSSACPACLLHVHVTPVVFCRVFVLPPLHACVSRRRAPIVGLDFCFGSTCSPHQLPPTPRSFIYSFHIRTARQTTLLEKPVQTSMISLMVLPAGYVSAHRHHPWNMSPSSSFFGRDYWWIINALCQGSFAFGLVLHSVTPSFHLSLHSWSPDTLRCSQGCMLFKFCNSWEHFHMFTH